MNIYNAPPPPMCHHMSPGRLNFPFTAAFCNKAQNESLLSIRVTKGSLLIIGPENYAYQHYQERVSNNNHSGPQIVSIRISPRPTARVQG